MENTNKFALIGRTLKHSYSKPIHNMLGDYDYDLVELESEEIEGFVKSEKYKGFNVTIPYKTEIMKYLDRIDDKAKAIGAVNTVVEQDGLLVGYNTDFEGMKYMLFSAGIELKDKSVVVLGSGGTSKTACAVAKSLGAKKITVVSRSGKVNYENVHDLLDTQVIINTTPVGMYPDNYQSPLDISGFERLEGVADVIYNPSKTKICFDAELKCLKSVNGLKMLIGQAKCAMEKFLNQSQPDKVIEEVFEKMVEQKQNVVLIGMPGVGKSTIGKRLEELTGKRLVDTDLEIVKRDGRDIPTIFNESGEEYFRELESLVIKDVCKQTGKIISTGGGVVKNSANLYPLKSNGKVFWITRSIEKLVTDGRPLSKDLQTVKKLFEERKDLYARFSDCVINNDCDLEQTVKGVIENL